jgi:hypothetical protein
MANSMTPGEVYLVEEIDPRTGEATDYCKIGIVRERDGRDSSNRASEHQTGNPRKLVVAQTVKTEIVEAVETTLHQLHSPQRISGEWFFMTKPERERAMDVARALATQAASGAKAMKKALELKDTPSAGETIDATAEARSAFDRAMVLTARVNRIDSVINRIQEILLADIKEEGGETRFGKVQERKGREVFDEEAFKKAHPDLHGLFTTEKTTVTGSFRWAKSSVEDDSADISLLDQRAFDAAASADAGLRNAELHAVYLDCLALRALDAWNFDIVEAEVRVLCGTAPGITGVCTWNRIAKTKSSFDKVGLRKEHPGVYAEFVTQAEGTTAGVIARDQGFQH